MAIIDRELECAVCLKDDEALCAARAQVVSLVETQVFELARRQDRVDAEICHRTDSGSQEDLAAGRDRIAQIQVALVELVVGHHDAIEVCQAKAAAFADGGAHIFEGDTAVFAKILRLHLIDFLSAFCGIAVFLASTRSIAADFLTGKLIQAFFYSDRADRKVAADEEAGAPWARARFFLHRKIASVDAPDDFLDLLAARLELALGDLHRLRRFARQVCDLDLGRSTIGLRGRKMEQCVLDVIEGVGSRFTGFDAPNDDLPLVTSSDAVGSNENFAFRPSKRDRVGSGWYAMATGLDNVVHRPSRDPPVVFRIAMLDRPLGLPCLIEARAEFGFARYRQRMRGLQPIEHISNNVVHFHECRLSTAASKFHDMGVEKPAWTSLEQFHLAVGPDRFLLPGNLQGWPRLHLGRSLWRTLQLDQVMLDGGHELGRIAGSAIRLN
ncbi:hypothetical protein SDC9_122985 [bioreactor metagenome]|uniref:Uncharacterized protein n=1 Tax=bioreactor metagenome TaxID=1076179 RepID=A0A645CGB3_9ZZZZ